MGQFDWSLLRTALQNEGFSEKSVEDIEELVKECHEEEL